MKKIFYLFILLAFACSKDNDDECDALYEKYIQALGFAGGGQAAIEEVTRQYNERRADLGCD